MERYFFKVIHLKLYAEEKGVIGIVVPNISLTGSLDANKYTTDFYTLDNQVFKNVNLNRALELKAVILTDEDLKEKINIFIDNAKKVFSMKKKYCEEQIKVLKETKEIETRLSEIQNSFVEIQGLMTKNDFLKEFETNSNEDYEFGWEFGGLKVKAITLTKEYFSGRHLDVKKYDFLYRDYEGDLVAHYDMIEKNQSEDFRKIKSDNFKEITTNKLGNHNIVEDFYVNEGDKNSFCIEHKVILNLKNPLELRESNIVTIKSLRKSFKDLLNSF